MYVIANGKGIATQEVQLFSGLRLRILRQLAKGASYPKEIARSLGIEEQKIYYHMRKLERQGLIRLAAREDRGGAAAKIYELSAPSFFARLSEWQSMQRVPASSSFLSPFVRNGAMNALIVTGSPDPHGPERARSRDITYAVDLALFLGTFLLNCSRPYVAVDTEMRSLRGNLIVVGGPVTNSVAKRINDKMPLRFDAKKNIFSTHTKKLYKNEDAGLIVKTPNPFDAQSQILWIAGKRYSGTKATVLAFLKYFGALGKKNTHVVQGFDMDGDGEVDDVRIIE